MKKWVLYFLLWLLSAGFLILGMRADDDVDDDYLGQPPPGIIPSIFAPGTVSTPEALEIGCTWSPDGREFYFVRQSDKGWMLLLVDRIQQGWNEARELEHFKLFPGFEPFISPDGGMFYYTRIELPQSEGEKQEPVSKIWKMGKKGISFGNPRIFISGMACSAAENGNFYLTRVAGEKPGICVICPDGEGGYGEMELLGGGVNYPVMGAHPCIGQGERYIVFDSKRGRDPENADLFVCFRLDNGGWSGAVSLGDSVNTRWNDLCPSLSPDGKYLFYMSKGDIYWVSSRLIESLVPEGIGNTRGGL